MLHLCYYVNYDFSRALKSTMIFILSIVRTKLKGLKQCIIFSLCCNSILSYYATCFNKTLPDLTLKSQFSSVQSFFISATCRTKYLHQRNYTTEKGTCNKTKQRCNMQKLNKLH